MGFTQKAPYIPQLGCKEPGAGLSRLRLRLIALKSAKENDHSQVSESILMRTDTMHSNARRIWDFCLGVASRTPQNCATMNQVTFQQLIYSQEVREGFLDVYSL